MIHHCKRRSMIFIKKLLEKDKKQAMLISFGLIFLFFIIKLSITKMDSSDFEQELRLPSMQNNTSSIPQYPGWNSIPSQPGDNLGILFNRAGLSQKTLQTILINNPYGRQLHRIQADQVYYFKINQEDLQELLFFVDKNHFLRVTKTAAQKYQTMLHQGSIPTFIEPKNPIKKLFSNVQTKQAPTPVNSPAIVTPTTSHWVSISVKRGDTLGRIFKRAGLPYKTMIAIVNHNPHKKELAKLNPKFAIHFRIENHQLQEMILPLQHNKYLLIRPQGRQYQTLVRLGKPQITSTSPVVSPPAPAVQAPRIAAAPTTPIPSPAPPKDSWVTIKPNRGDTLGRIFSRAGLNQKDLHQVLYKNPYARQLSRINLNDEIRFKTLNHQLIEMVYNLDALRFITITRQGPIYKTQVHNRPKVQKVEYVSTPVRGSLYYTAKLAGIPTKLIEQINQIFFWQVQLSREIRAGDRLNIAYQTFYVNGKKVAVGDILAVSYKHANGVKYEAVRHQSRNGQVHYYRPNGTSLKKAFSRYPIRFSHISSNFGSSRKHPILHYRRPHKGIDLAAPIGTPIYAIGDGRISFIGRQNGYGNMIKINHAFSYTTVYAHMLRFQKGLRNGSNVQKGQIIGYVGQSGLATGPHCHYELHVNHIPRNPTSVALPQALPITRQETYAFNRFTREIMAQINLYEATKLASRR